MTSLDSTCGYGPLSKVKSHHASQDPRSLRILPATSVFAGNKHFRPRPNSKFQFQRQVSSKVGKKGRDRYGTLSKTRSLSSPALLSVVHEQQAVNSAAGEPDRASSSSEEDEEEEVVTFWELAREKRFLAMSIAITDFNAMCCMSVLAPFFTKEAELRGANEMIAGWIFAIFALVQFFLSPIVGNLMATMGVWFFYQGGLFFAGGCSVLFGVLAHMPLDDGGTTFIIYCFVLRVFLSIGCTAMSTASFAITADEFADHASVMFGVMETFCGLGLMVGPALGGFLYAVGGFSLPFYVTGGSMLCTVIFNQLVLPNGVASQLKIKSFPASILLSIPSIPVVLISLVVVSTVWSAFDPILEPHLRQYHISSGIVGLLFLLSSFTYAISSPLWGWLSEKAADSKAMLALGFLLTAAVLLVFGPSPLVGFPDDYNTLWLNIVSLGLLGGVCSMALVPTFENLLDAADLAGIDDDLGLYCTVAGLWSACDALGEFIGPALSGWLWQSVGFAWFNTYLAMACVAAAAMLFVLYLVERKCGRFGIQPLSRRKYFQLMTMADNEESASLILPNEPRVHRPTI